MRLATLLGSGRETSARAFVAEAVRAGVPRVEVDRWLVLASTTALPDLSGDLTAGAAARRLAVARDDSIVDQWLAARWFTGRDTDLAADLSQNLRGYLHAEPDPLPIHQSLVDDLEARERIAAGDTAAALATWREVLHIRADAALTLGDTALARNTYADLLQLLINADGAGVATRERTARELERLTTR